MQWASAPSRACLSGCADWPQARGVAHDIDGTRVDFTMQDVIRALGTREPATSRCHYKVGFVFVHRPGEHPSDGDLEKLERYRVALETWYAWATDGRGSLDTRIDGCGTGTDQCPGDPSLHCGVVPPPDDDASGGADDVGSDTADAWADLIDDLYDVADIPATDSVVPDTIVVGPGGTSSCGCALVR